MMINLKPELDGSAGRLEHVNCELCGGEVVHSHGLAVAMVKRVHGEMVEAADEEAGVRREMDEQMGEVLAVSLGAGEYALVLSDADQ